MKFGTRYKADSVLRRRSGSFSRLFVVCGLGFLMVFSLLLTGARADSPVNALLNRSMEDLMSIPVDSVGFYEMPADQLPGSVWVLDQDLLSLIPGVSLGEMIHLSVPGVQISSDGFTGALYTTRGCPMSDNSTTQFMWDGINLNAAGSLGINSSLKSTLLGDISKVEVSNGPSSMLHGNGAINGFVNQVPKSGASHPGAWVNTLMGLQEGLVKTEAGYGRAYGPGKDFYIYAGGEQSSGFIPNRDLGYQTYTAGQISPGFRVQAKDKINYRLSLNWNHNALKMVGFIHREWASVDSYSSGMTASPDVYYQTLALRPSLSLPLTGTETLSVNLPVALFDNGYLFDRIRSDGSLIPVNHGNSDIRVETNWVLRSLRWEQQQWATGIRVSSDRHRNNRYLFRTDPPESFFGEDIHWKEYSIFAEDIITILPRWTVTAGLRFNAIRYEFDGQDTVVSRAVKDSQRWFPRLSSALRLGEDTVVKLSYQEGFHYPSATALYDSNMEPEYLETIEANLLHTLPEMNLSITVNGFFNTYKNALLAGSQIPGDPTHRKFCSLGGEILLDWQGPDTLRTRLSYAYTRPRDFLDEDAELPTVTEDFSEWTYYPSHALKALVSRSWLNRDLTTSLSMEWASGVDHRKGSYYAPRDLFLGNRYTLSFKAGYKVSDSMELSMVVRNILDNNIPVPVRDYLYPWEGALGDTETRVYLGLTWHL